MSRIVRQSAPGAVLALAITMTSCDEATPDRPATPVDNALIEAVRCSEIGFSKAAERRDRAAFVASVDPEAHFVGASVSRGHAEILAAWGVFFEPDGPAIKWRPQSIDVLSSGDLAFSRGVYRIERTTETGELAADWGYFNTVWRRSSEGRWVVIFDAGGPPSPAAPPNAEAVLDAEGDCTQ